MNDRHGSAYEAAIGPLLDWLGSKKWVNSSDLEDFYIVLSNTVESTAEDLLSHLPIPFWSKAARCFFDDLLTAGRSITPCNILDRYLEEVGGSLGSADVEFLTAFRSTVVRVYRVVERTPSGSVVLRGISGGEGPIRIPDEFATAALSAGDHIATRILTIGGSDLLAGQVLYLGPDVLAPYKESFEQAFKEALSQVEKHLQKDLGTRSRIRLKVERQAAPVLSGLWVATILEGLADAPFLAKEDDPDSLFEAVVPFSSGIDPIVECLDSHPGVDRPIPKALFWHWNGDRKDSDASLKAQVWISGSEIFFESCEESRIEAAVVELRERLGEILGEGSIWLADGVEVPADWDDISEGEEDDEPLVPERVDDEEESAYFARVHAFLARIIRLRFKRAALCVFMV